MSRMDNEIKLEEMKDPDQEKFLFAFTPSKIDTESIAGISLKNGVRILVGILLYEGLYSLNQSYETSSSIKFVFRLIAGICYLCIACFTCYITFFENAKLAKIAYVIICILFILEVLYYLLKSFLRLFEFINPWDGDFLSLKEILSIFGDFAYLFILLYFIYVLFCYIVSLKKPN